MLVRGGVGQMPSPSGVGGETVYCSINSYNMGAGGTIRAWSFRSCIPDPPRFYLPLCSRVSTLPMKNYRCCLKNMQQGIQFF